MMIAIFFWWIGLSIVVAVAANTRGRSPIAWFIYAIIFSPLLSGLLLLALPNLSKSFAAGRMYLEGELREFEERRRRRAIVARIAAVVVVLMGIVAWMMLAWCYFFEALRPRRGAVRPTCGQSERMFAPQSLRDHSQSQGRPTRRRF